MAGGVARGSTGHPALQTFVFLHALRGEFSGNLCGEIGFLSGIFFTTKDTKSTKGGGNTKERAGVSF